MGCGIGRILWEIKSINDSIWGKGVYRARKFCTTVNNAIRSVKISNSKPPDKVHCFSFAVDNTIMGDVRSFSLVVDDAIRSRKSSQEAKVLSFDWVVNNAIRSAEHSEEHKPPNNVCSFDSVVNNAIRSENNSVVSQPPDIVPSFDCAVMNNAIRSARLRRLQRYKFCTV
ncbi:hypothetical protein ACSQ67_013283 [Phaseolus vulgaris]